MKTRWSVFIVLLILVGFAEPASAVDYNLTFGGAYAAGSAATGTTAQSFLGSGSWFKTLPVSPVVELYIDPVSQLGGGFTVGQIQAIRYRTLNDGTNPSGVDYFLKIYTVPYTGGDATWYGNRLNAEPLYSNAYAPAANVWVPWDTNPGTNQLVFFDGNHTTNFGFSGGPTLQDLTAGPITWSSYPNAGAGSDTTPIDYASQPVEYLVLGTGSGWSSFTGYLDAIEIDLTNGDTYTIDLENFVNEVWVDDDWVGSVPGVEVAPGKFFGHNAFATIQDGVDNVFGSTVHVAAGTYEEQVVVAGKDVLIQGAGPNLTFVNSPAVLDTVYMSGANPNKPVMAATGASNVVIQDLTVDGLGRGNANYRMMGIAYYNAGGAVLNCNITGIVETPLSGNQHGVGIQGFTDDGGPYTLEAGGLTIDNFQKNASSFSGAGLTVNVHDCVMTGSGDTALIAQNGIQISFGAGGSIADCTVSAMRYTPATWTSSGVLIYDAAGGVTTTGSLVVTSDVQTPVYWQDTDGSMDGVDVTGGDFDGIFVYNSSASKPMAGAGPTAGRRIEAAPFDAGTGPALSPGVSYSSQLTRTVAISNACVSGLAVAGTWGIDAYSEGGPLNVTVTDSRATGYDLGLVAVGALTSLTAHDNYVAGNVTAGYDNTLSGLAQNAAFNWWGAADGPSGDGAGTGDAVASVAGEVTFDPFRIDGASSTACAFTQGNNVVTPVPDSPCLSTVNPCATVSFEIARSDNVPLRGFSVTFQLSPELQLCTGSLSDILEGSYLNSVGATNMQVLDNGGGSYTVDGTILGLPCGVVAPTGTLFTVEVGPSGGDGTGMITVTGVLMRDCVNAPITADAGGVGLLTIDTAGPAGTTDLVASQVKTGNDTDGTTKIQLTFTMPGDAVSVAAYRKGFGSYPEYDDLTGAVPTTPATPAAALGDGWVLAAGVTASGDFDEAATRDFWYYVIFSTDACGNVSAVSNRTGGTLGYHLGDVTDGVTPGTGENTVDFLDISALGAAYGTSDGDANYRNYIDVGPTTDFSVDARPTTDNQIQFEDLMMFAINHGQVSKPGGPAPSDHNAIMAHVPGLPAPGGTFEVILELASDGTVQGLSVPLRWNASVVEPIGFRPGDLLARQAGRGLALSPEPGMVDATVFGSAFSGDGDLAALRFRVLAGGDAGIALGEVTARDTDNHPVVVEGAVMAEDGHPGVTPELTRLLPSAPNPFRAGTRVAFSLAAPGMVTIRVFSLDGRLVRTLLEGAQPAGDGAVRWNGRDESGHPVASGSYLIRFEAPGRTGTQRVVRLR